MSQWYCDHGCTLYPTAYMAVPASAASLPQEGDGKASGTGAAPAVAVATMNFSAATAAAGATFAVHGAALTCVASGATSVQFNAGSGATLATNLAAAINAATAVPTTTTGGLAPYLRALVWAVASGTVLSVYTRIASADLNTAANASAILTCGATANWTAPPANSSFSGGVSGPWSRFFNNVALTAAVNATVSAAGTYGAKPGTTMSLPVGGDTLNIRTGRAGSNIQILLGAGNYTVLARTIGSPTAYLNFLFDNGTVWAGDNNIFEIVQDGASSVILQPAGYSKWTGQMQSGSLATAGAQPNFRLGHTYTNNAGYNSLFRLTNVFGTHHTIIEAVEVADTGSGGALVGGWFFGPMYQTDPLRPAKIINSRLGVGRSNSAILQCNSSYPAVVEIDDCHVLCGGSTTYNNVVATFSNASNCMAVRMLRPKFSGGGGGHHSLLPAFSNHGAAISLVIEDPVDLGAFLPGDVAASLCGRIAGTGSTAGGAVDLFQHQSVSSPTMFLHDTARRIIEWRPVGMPTTGLSVLPDGVTPYVLRFGTVHTGLATGLVTRCMPQRCIKQSNVNTLGAGARTLTQHILIDASYGGSAYTPTDADWWIEGTYLAADGTTKVFSTRGTGTALAADTQAWSSLTFAPFAGSARTYSRWKMTAALANVKASSIVTSYVVCATQPLTLSEWVFVDPHFELT